MSNVAIIVGSIGGQNGQLHLSGVAITESPQLEFSWEALLSFGANPIITGVGIRQAVVAAAAQQGITILPADQQTIYGGPSVN